MFSWISKIFKPNKNARWGSLVQPSATISEDSSIGAHTYIGFNSFITKTSIGRYCSIANNVAIGHGEHDVDALSTSSIFYENAYAQLTEKDCTIGNDVWIGVNATIRRGITIGDGAVIGANAFVNKDVPPFAIVGGVPAKLIRFRFTENQQQMLVNSGWWNKEPGEAKKILEALEANPQFK